MVDEEKVKEEAKNIMDDFVKSLSELDIESNFKLERKRDIREKDKMIKPEEFRKKVLDNAPETENDCIKAEEKNW